MRKLKVDLAGLVDAFEAGEVETAHYLDLETGEVVMIYSEFHYGVAGIYDEESGEEEEDEVVLSGSLPQSDPTDWLTESLREARRVRADDGSRYLGVPRSKSYEGYGDMVDFIATVQDQRLQSSLERAIRGQGAFRRFKDVLIREPGERERWFRFKDDRTEKRVLEWLESKGIEAIVEPASEVGAMDQRSPPVPSNRVRLLAEVLAFVRAARELPGVTRIALVGSLTTDKAEPKDADLLVTIANDADLAPLATLARRLQGRAQSFNRGGDVFLADPEGRYIGRTCDWKECRPGIRQSCDALNCGLRHYLHDDLNSVRLRRELIAAPPIELWPEVKARVPVPADLQQEVMEPLTGE